jgi:hypothetical protein
LSNKPLIFILLLLLSGCSVIKTGVTGKTDLFTNIKETRDGNLSCGDFNIIRADIAADINGEKQKFLASFKYEFPDRWMISLRSNTGIEAVRAWITVDTVLINDRLHKKLYYGSGSIIKKKYGVPVYAIPVVFGDLIESGSGSTDSTRCINGMQDIIGEFNNLKEELRINCREKKVTSCRIRNYGKGEIQFVYSKFKKIGKKEFPGKIVISYPEENINIELSIRKIDLNGVENMNFIPGKGYERILIK